MAQTRHGMPPEFLDTADEFVQLANKFGDQYSHEFVQAALAYAAARYTAFVWLTREDASQSVEAAAGYYGAEFDKMLRDNVEELTPVYRGAPQ